MRKSQRGVTFLGWIFLLAPMALVLYAGIRLTPVYLEHMKIARTLEQVRDESKTDQMDIAAIRTTIEKRFDIESVTVMTISDRDKLKISRDDGIITVQAVYSQTVPFIGNVSLTAHFDKSVRLE